MDFAEAIATDVLAIVVVGVLDSVMVALTRETTVTAIRRDERAREQLRRREFGAAESF